MHDDDALWLDALAGRATNDSATTREAHLLRAALSAREVQDLRVEKIDPAREQMLLARARRDGLIAAPRQRPQRLWFGLAAAAVVCLAFGLSLVQKNDEDAFVVRSAQGGTIQMTTADPHALKLRLLADLRAAGVKASGYQRLGSEGIDADLPPVLPESIVAVLNRYGLTRPADGVLRIEIAPLPDQ